MQTNALLEGHSAKPIISFHENVAVRPEISDTLTHPYRGSYKHEIQFYLKSNFASLTFDK